MAEVGESLRKAGWMQTIEKDQGAFDETVLEVLGLEVGASTQRLKWHQAVERGEEGYDSHCAQYVFPNAKGNHEAGAHARSGRRRWRSMRCAGGAPASAWRARSAPGARASSASRTRGWPT